MPFYVNKVAVLGAGVMGAQIAAHMANANIPTVLFDLASQEGGANAIINKAIKGLKKLQPSPIAFDTALEALTPANYDTDLEQLADCDVIIEAIAENMDWKAALYEKIAPHVRKDAILATNSSGLSINKLADSLPGHLRSQFCGIHFFNPPRYMPLVELIPHEGTDLTLLPKLETFLTTALGKSIIYAKDTPNFIANRVGVFSMLVACHHTEQFNLGFDVVDQLTGPKLGRPKSATYRTADLVGLDVLSHVVKTMTDNLSTDPWAAYYNTPEFLKKLIHEGALGQKTKKGVYTKINGKINVLDLSTNEYRISDQKPSAEVSKILKERDLEKRFEALRASDDDQAQFIWACFRDVFHYAAYHLESIADNVRDVDLAIRWGFGWKQGIFEAWQAAGWNKVANWIKEDIEAGKTLSNVALPAWVFDIEGVYNDKGAYSPITGQYEARRSLPVYERQAYPDAVLGETFSEGETIFENDSARLWHTGDNIAVLSFKTKMCMIGSEVLDSIAQAVHVSEEEGYKGLVVWQRHSDNFSVGANLVEFAEQFLVDGTEAVAETLEKFQTTMLKLRYAKVPTVAAVKGYVFGGGCELMLHTDRVVAALESYVGLVEVGVGIIPGGGGCKEMALRASRATNPFKEMETYYKNIAMGEVAKSACLAKEMGYLREGDPIIFNAAEILHVAKAQITALHESGYRPPLPPKIPVLGRPGIATIKMLLVNMRDGGFISDHDYLIATKVANVVCGGDLEPGTMVDEDWYLRLEREAFIELIETEKTQARMQYMLENGKPLRN